MRVSAGHADEPEWKRRRRLAATFGEVLPEATSDDADGPGEAPESSADPLHERDRWLRDQVPPHHGD